MGNKSGYDVVRVSPLSIKPTLEQSTMGRLVERYISTSATVPIKFVRVQSITEEVTLDPYKGVYKEERRPGKPIPGVADLFGDLYRLMYNYKFVQAENIPDERKVNKALVEAIANFPLLDRDATIGNMTASLSAASELLTSLLDDETIRQAIEEQDTAESNADENKRKKGKKRPTGEGKGEPTGERKGEPTGERKGEPTGEGKGEPTQTDKASDRIKKLSDHPIGKHVFGEAIKKGADAARETKSFMKSWGMENGDIKNLDDVDKIIQMSKDMDMKKIVDIMGRAKGVGKQAIEKAKESAIAEVVDFKYTKDMSWINKASLAPLSPMAPDTMRIMALKSLVEDGLWGVEPKSPPKSRAGSLLIYVDESGSMSDIIRQTKATAIGVVMALRDYMDKRRYYVMRGFDSSLLFRVTKTDDWTKHIDFIQSFSGGGTNFNNPLRDAIAEYKDIYSMDVEAPDVCIITDGEGGMDSKTEKDFMEFKDKTGARLIVFYIGTSPHRSILRPIVDAGVEIPSISPEDSIDKIASALAEFVAKNQLDRISNQRKTK